MTAGLFYGIAMLGALLLAVGGLWMWRRNRMHGALMLLAAAVVVFNVWSWSTLPAPAPAPSPVPTAAASGGLAAAPAR